MQQFTSFLVVSPYLCHLNIETVLHKHNLILFVVNKYKTNTIKFALEFIGFNSHLCCISTCFCSGEYVSALAHYENGLIHDKRVSLIYWYFRVLSSA